ncbi:MAG: histidine phosphatase family protein [Spirochaetota bacterium]
MKKINFLLFRHAECEMNLIYHIFVGGRSNSSPLTPLGIEQATNLGKNLQKQGLRFDKVFSSTAVRTIATATYVGEYLGFSEKDIATSEELLELDQGEWEGMRREKAYTPEILAKINSDAWNFCPPGGESQKIVAERMFGWVQSILTTTSVNSTIAVFSHGVAIKCLLRAIMNFDANITYKIHLDNCALTQLCFHNDLWEIVCINQRYV